MAFRVGQKVVCVPHPDALCGSGEGPGPALGQTYTIRDVDRRMAPHGLPLVLRFDEIVGNRIKLSDRLGGYEWEVGSDARNFRPVQSTDTGMTILEQIRRDVSNKTALPIKEDEQA